MDQSAKKLLNTQSRQLPWSCFQHAQLLTVCCVRVRHPAHAYESSKNTVSVLSSHLKRCITHLSLPPLVCNSSKSPYSTHSTHQRSPFGDIPEIFTLTTPSWMLTVQYLEKLSVNGWDIMAAGSVQNQVLLSCPVVHSN